MLTVLPMASSERELRLNFLKVVSDLMEIRPDTYSGLSRARRSLTRGWIEPRRLSSPERIGGGSRNSLRSTQSLSIQMKADCPDRACRAIALASAGRGSSGLRTWLWGGCSKSFSGILRLCVGGRSSRGGKRAFCSRPRRRSGHRLQFPIKRAGVLACPTQRWASAAPRSLSCDSSGPRP